MVSLCVEQTNKTNSHSLTLPPSAVQPAHRLSGLHSQSSAPTTQDIPLVYTPENAASRGVYSQPSAGLSDTNIPRMPQYKNLEGSRGNQWMEQQEKKSKRSRLIVSVAANWSGAPTNKPQVIGTVVALLGLIVVGVVVGVVVSNNNKKPSNRSSSGSSGPSQVNQTDPNDPSTFVKDSRLKKSFWGLAYTPEGSLLPNCGNSLSVLSDLPIRILLTQSCIRECH